MPPDKAARRERYRKYFAYHVKQRPARNQAAVRRRRARSRKIDAGPLAHTALGIALAAALGLSRGDALLLTVLCASASYIAVPAAIRHALPEASPGVYVPMALALTFPFNITIGLPLYLAVIDRLWS